MYKTFKVRNFRGLRNLDIDSLERVNLIAGKNNVGKTALLEALWLHAVPDQPRIGLATNELRGLQNHNVREAFHALFHNFNPDPGIKLSASGDWGQNDRFLRVSLAEIGSSQITLGSASSAQLQRMGMTRRVSNERVVLEYTDESGNAFESDGWITETQMDGSTKSVTIEERRSDVENRTRAILLPFPHRLDPSDDAEIFSDILIARRHRKVESVMRRVEPRLKELSVITRASAPIIHAELEGQDRLLPIRLLGDGVTRLLSIALAMVSNTAGGLVLVDEIENGLHHSVMQSVWSGIAQFAREFDVQIFATTHSWECIRAAHKAFMEDELYDFRLHRLDRIGDDDDIRAVTYDQETLDAALEMEFEVR